MSRKSVDQSSLPTEVSTLEKASYNPRRMSREAKDALKKSLETFGDISGIVYNFSTNRLVAGHQRQEALASLDPGSIVWGEEVKTLHGVERQGTVRTAKGALFNVRGVSWPETKEKAANIAANSPFLQGEFTDDLRSLLAEIGGTDFSAGLRFDSLEDLLGELQIDSPAQTTPEVASTPAATAPATPRTAPEEFPGVSPEQLQEAMQHECPRCGFTF